MAWTTGIRRVAGVWPNASRMVAVVLLLAPAVMSAQRKRFLAPTDQTIRSTTEQGYGSTPAQLIYVENSSSVQIVVFSTALRDCENVRQSCNPSRLNRKIPAGGRVMVQRVEPKNENQGFRYRFSFGWRADSSDAETLRFLAENGSEMASQRLESYEAAAAARTEAPLVRDLDLTNEEVEKMGDRIAAITLHPDSVVLRVGQMFLLRQVRVLARDSAGGPLGRVYALNWRYMPGTIAVRADTIVGQQAGRAELLFRLTANPNRTATLPVIVVPD